MKENKVSTALIGFGKVAQAYSKDPLTAKYYPYATHAQVLKAHPNIKWDMVVDPNHEAQKQARENWGINYVSSVIDFPDKTISEIEMVVLTTPPSERIDLVSKFPNLKAVLVEKPLGLDFNSSSRFVDYCNQRNLIVQVNLWRRADHLFRELANGMLEDLIGVPQSVFGFFGNGLINNGIHLIDFARMLFGEVKSVQRIQAFSSYSESPIKKDLNFGFSLEMSTGVVVFFSPLSFEHYRENGFSIWGTSGKLDILNEGLSVLYYPKGQNRAISNEMEINYDKPVSIESTVGHAFYNIYDNLLASLLDKEKLFSCSQSALVTSQVLDTLQKAPLNGEVLNL